MRKMKMLLFAGLLVLTMGMLTACGNDNNNADETPITEEDSVEDENIIPDDDVLTEENIPQTTVVPEQEVQDEYGGTVTGNDAMIRDNGTDGSINENPNAGNTVDGNSINENDGTVSGALGDSVENLGEGVGEAVRDVSDAVGNAVNGR